MSPIALAMAAMRTVPMALCLPLPGLFSRLALGLVLATFGATLPQDPSWLHAAVSGIAFGLIVLAPVWAARWAGSIVGWTSRVRALEGVYTTLAWLAFFAAGGPLLLLRGSTLQPATASLASEGTRFLGLAASIALPTLLALAIVEVLAALAERVERAAETPLHTQRMAHAARPLFASLLILAGLASLIQGIGHATRETPVALAPAR